ncbi:VOC family protein [Paenibacillus rigui]|uniref:Glyoxalase n=1 Tax=Paenibacillus rigui TaxID=554312 RepID=A0A229UXJ6_9BACL|nr:VOC family protein [Paenibacillus rigui]OXM87679.1 glyoxalase [Paenibacillus rigui]
MAVRRMEHVGVMVKQIEPSAAFYEKVLGLELKEIIPHTNGVIRLAFLGFRNQDETEMELVEGYNDSLPNEGKVHHLAFTVDDIEEEWERIRGLAVTFVDSEITTLPNGSRYFFIEGPDGERIELFQSTRG